MNKLLLSLLVAVCSISASSQTKTAAGPMRTAVSPTLPITRVILYSNGVAYFERRGIVSGNARIDLDFKQSQIDDVLKSLTVLDLGNGSIGGVSYNSKLPASARKAEIPFTVDALSNENKGLPEVLAQLQGTRVAVAAGGVTAAGSILTVERYDTPKQGDRPAMIDHRVVLASESGDITAVRLSEVRSIKILDESTRGDIGEFASASASARRRDAKTVSITANGDGMREIAVSYTVAAPIWKTTYRVVLDEAGRPFFQGWAIIDNTGDEDWQNVRLSLVSGAPISFIQNLQRPLFRDRPVVPIPDGLNLRPQIYDPEDGSGYGDGTGSGGGMGSGSGAGQGVTVSASAIESLPSQFSDANANYMVSTGLTGRSVSDALVSERSGITAEAEGAEVGDLFEYRIGKPISVQRNRSALIPIIQMQMEGERVSIFRAPAARRAADDDDEDDYEEDDDQASYRAATHRAMNGILLKNTSDMTFEGGPMTILDRDTYAGEALMERLRPKEQRLISFAADLGTLIRIEQNAEREPAKMIKAVGGVLQVHYFKTDKRTYRLSNQTDKPRRLYIEHPVRKDWVLSKTYAQPDYTTARFYRFVVDLPPRSTKDVVVGENLGMMDSYKLLSFSPKDLELFVSGSYLDENIRKRLARLIELRIKLNDLEVKRVQGEKEAETIAEDQERFRENIEALAKTPDAKRLIARYIAKAEAQEARLEEIAAARKAIDAESIGLQREVAAEIKNLELGN